MVTPAQAGTPHPSARAGRRSSRPPVRSTTTPSTPDGVASGSNAPQQDQMVEFPDLTPLPPVTRGPAACVFSAPLRLCASAGKFPAGRTKGPRCSPAETRRRREGQYRRAAGYPRSRAAWGSIRGPVPVREFRPICVHLGLNPRGASLRPAPIAAPPRPSHKDEGSVIHNHRSTDTT